EKEASLKLWVWDNYSNLAPSAASVYTTNMRDVRIKNDGMVFTIAFVPDDVDPTPPEWASELPSLGAADGGANSPGLTTSTTQATGTTVATPGTQATSESTPSTDETSSATTSG